MVTAVLLGMAANPPPHLSRLALAQPRSNIHQATIEEPNQTTPEISTEDLKNLLTKGNKQVWVFDVRSAKAFDIAHIPGSINPPENKEVEFITQAYPDKTTSMVIYCAGLH